MVPATSAIDEVWSYACEWAGLVSLAVIDSEGRMHGFEGERAYVSASAVKALLLVAELERREAGGLPLDGTTRALLTRMITISDNNAADAIYERVGDVGLYEAAGLDRDEELQRRWVLGQCADHGRGHGALHVAAR